MNPRSGPHPCFSCKLPDCDDTAKGCALKRALRDYSWRRIHKLEITDDLRRRRNIAHQELYGLARDERNRAKRRAVAL